MNIKKAKEYLVKWEEFYNEKLQYMHESPQEFEGHQVHLECNDLSSLVFKIDEQFFSCEYDYSSWGDSEYRLSTLKEVFPKQKTVTYYEA